MWACLTLFINYDLVHIHICTRKVNMMMNNLFKIDNIFFKHSIRFCLIHTTYQILPLFWINFWCRMKICSVPSFWCLIPPFNRGFVLFLLYSLILPMSGQVFYWSTILVLIALVWTDFTLDKCILGWGFSVLLYLDYI